MACINNNWIDDINDTFPEGNKKGQNTTKFKHSFEGCLKDSKRFTEYTDWVNFSYKYYLAASRYGWLQQIKQTFEDENS